MTEIPNTLLIQATKMLFAFLLDRRAGRKRCTRGHQCYIDIIKKGEIPTTDDYGHGRKFVLKKIVTCFNRRAKLAIDIGMLVEINAKVRPLSPEE